MLVVGHLDVVLVADLGEHQAKPHAPLGDLAVLLARLLLGRAFVGEGAVLPLEVVLDRAARSMSNSSSTSVGGGANWCTASS